MLHFGLIAKVSNLLLLFTVNTIIMLVIAVIDTRYNTNCLETVSTVEAHNYLFLFVRRLFFKIPMHLGIVRRI